ncbi:DUF2169 family type VI secretion system accessory protein [Sulfurimonas sp.]|uniref:DUF2169 family type VI secretion system accessory protein n=1 Tax=Sulfurimonas sp. TaxID=2022749 RepID=UPI003D0E4D46
MELDNYTPFPSLAWENVDANNEWYVSVVSKVKLDIQVQSDDPKLHLKLSKDQGGLHFCDVFHGEPTSSSVRYESDLVPYKKHADIVLNARTFAPNSNKQKHWSCGVKIFDKDDKELKNYKLLVSGEKDYEKVGALWLPSMRKNVSDVNIRYEKSHGGTIKNKDGKIVKMDIYNPVGCGIKKVRDAQENVSAVQVEYYDYKLTKVPAGFGFISRSWKSRLAYAGTYDQAWIDNQHPLPPHDFDELHNQAAHPELIMDGYLQAGTKIELHNLIKEHKVAYIQLPSYQLLSRMQYHTGDVIKAMNLDTLVIDIDSEDSSKHCMYASYRVKIPKTQKVKGTQVMLLQEESANG